MRQTNINRDNTVFILVSFEGPDIYSQAGGLGVRVTNLAHTLAEQGFPTHLFFIGDPHKAGEEKSGDCLTLHRWCQWISKYHPQGVYQGENEKQYDFNRSLPGYVIDNIIKPAVAQDKLAVILGEEWQTAEVMCRFNDLLRQNRLRNRVVMFWNANNTFSFNRINWSRLSATTTITTVSRYMKYVMGRIGLNPLVIPNGIPRHLLTRVNPDATVRLQQMLNADIILNKVARWDPDKRWHTAIAATSRLRARGLRTVLLARGGIEPHGNEVLKNARSLGLTVKDINCDGNTIEDYLHAFAGNGYADVLNIRFHCPQEFLRIIYQASDAVLANSRHEPFGLVGLETMAAGGIAFTGGTGEDYAIPGHNSIVLDTSDPKEIENNVIHLMTHPDYSERIRKAAWQTASLFTWEEIVQNLIRKLELQAHIQGTLAMPVVMPPAELKIEDFITRRPVRNRVLVGSV